VYSAAESYSGPVSSNGVFAVEWSWPAVAGAAGYLALSISNGLGSCFYTNIAARDFNVGLSEWTDAGTGWQLWTGPAPPLPASPLFVGLNGLFLDGGSFNGDGSGLKDLVLAISGTNGTAPVNGTNAQAWVKVTLPDGSVWKTGLYK